MQLTADQKQALQRGEAVRLTEPETRAECVIIRADVYDQGRQIIEYDDSDWTEEEMRALAERTFDEADNAGPIQ